MILIKVMILLLVISIIFFAGSLIFQFFSKNPVLLKIEDLSGEVFVWSFLGFLMSLCGID